MTYNPPPEEKLRLAIESVTYYYECDMIERGWFIYDESHKKATEIYDKIIATLCTGLE